MGKTYVALAVMSLMRYFNPKARVLVIAPRQNIQVKWRKELFNFVRNNWQHIGNRVKNLEETPVWEPFLCESLRDFAHESLINQDRDFFLRMTSFSVAAKDPERRKRMRSDLSAEIPWLRDEINVDTATDFLETYAMAMNAAMPPADLVIVDEAHNLKKGLEGAKSGNISNRNLIMGRAFGSPTELSGTPPDWFSLKAKRVLLLSATPFEDDYAALHRQLEIFGFGDIQFQKPDSPDKLPISELSNRHADIELKRSIVERMMVRRTGGIEIGGEKYTKNMYRREWRHGGIQTHDRSIRIEDPTMRLIVGLMQKKVSEVLQNEKFNNSFQIGMLSSFESFSESLNTVTKSMDSQATEQTQENEMLGAFDASDQWRNCPAEVRQGIDSNAISRISRSFEATFLQRLPHPKQDQVVGALAESFESGEKALIFCRRVATVSELAGRLSERYNESLKSRLRESLLDLLSELQQIFDQYDQEYQSTRQDREFDPAATSIDDDALDDDHEAILSRDDLKEEPDTGDIKSFFEWFFRGEGPKGILSGAAFRRNRLDNARSAYAVLFEQNYLAELLRVEPAEVLPKLAEVLNLSAVNLATELRNFAHSYFHERTRTRDAYPRLYVFESYQFAGLRLLSQFDSELKIKAQIILQERFIDHLLASEDMAADRFPEPHEYLATRTFFTELRQSSSLYERLIPSEDDKDFRPCFRHQEQRRELLSAMVRLGAPFIDLYCLAIKQIGSFQLRSREREDNVVPRLAREFVVLLEVQRNQPGFHAFYELSQAADTFDTLVAVNFPDVNEKKVTELAKYYGTILGHQSPVGDVFGQVNKRLVSQFRMPGYPLVMISTDVLQEGEDLHTFCKRVLHYGIAWTSSSMEQRTGRVDRIGGLLQRNLDGKATEPNPEELIQVHYPYLKDTVEFLQVRRVLKRYNTFLELMHESFQVPPQEDSSINTNDAIHDEEDVEPQNQELLTSAFDVREGWLSGDQKASDVEKINWKAKFHRFKEIREHIEGKYAVKWELNRSDHEFEGAINTASFRNALPMRETHTHGFILRLCSHIAGEETLLQVESTVADVDLSDDDMFDLVESIACKHPDIKICVEPRVQRNLDRIYIKQEILFDLNSTQNEEAAQVFMAVVPPAAELHKELEVSLHDLP